MDLTRFHDKFFQECFEQLSAMETDILTLAGKPEAKTESALLNNLFRAAHSIKGASSTFGFADIAQFAHLLESIVAMMRSEKPLARQFTTEELLQALDCLSDLVSAHLEQREPDREGLALATEKLEEMLRATPAQAAIATAPPPLVKKKGAVTQPDLFIRFHPASHVFRSGTNPLVYLKELAKLGSVEVTLDSSRVSPLSEVTAEDCLLGWEVTLRNTFASASEVREIFAWVEGDRELTILELPDPALAGPSPSPSIRVAAEKIDRLVNMVGELAITQSKIMILGNEFQAAKDTKLCEHLAQLTRNTREIQDTVLKIKMLPISELFGWEASPQSST